VRRRPCDADAAAAVAVAAIATEVVNKKKTVKQNSEVQLWRSQPCVPKILRDTSYN